MQREFLVRTRLALTSTAVIAVAMTVASSFAAPADRRGADPEGGDKTNVFADASAACEGSEIAQTMWLHPQRLSVADEGGLAGSPEGGAVFLDTGSNPEGDGPHDVVYTPDGNSVLVVHRETDNVSFFNVNTRQVTNTVAVGDFPLGIAVTPDGSKAVVANTLSHTVSIIDIASHSVTATIPVTGMEPFRVAITPDSQFAVVAMINDAVNSGFSVINLNTASESHVIPTTSQGVIGFFGTPESGMSGPILTQFALTPDGNTIVLPDRGGAAVNLYDRATGALLNSLSVAAGPTSVDISADSTTAVIGHDSPGNAISEIDIPSQTVTGTFPTASQFGQVIRITPDKNFAITGILNSVIFVDLATGATTSTVATGSVGDIEISFDGQFAFVSNFNARIISIATQSLVGTVTFAACVEAACSPTQLRAVAMNTRFREDIHFYNINGGSSSLEGFASTGAPPEGDAARDLAISSDGETVVVCHNVSRNVAIVDPQTPSVQTYIEVGDRPLGAAITPDGEYAVVCATDANAVRIIDLDTNAIVASLTINTRPVHVRISPDSQWAYVLNVAGTDVVSFIQLNGAASTIVSQVGLGLQAGSAFGFAYSEVSGLELSADGSTLAVCDSFNDFLRLYDTASRTQIAQVPVGDFPIRVAFNPAGTRAFVTNAFGDSVSIVNVSGAASAVIATVPGIKLPLTVNVNAAGTFAYVGNTDSNNPRMFIISTASNTSVGSVVLTAPARETAYDPADGTLYAALNDGSLARIAASGASSSVIDTVALSAGPSDMVFDPNAKRAIMAQPIPDGIDIVTYAEPCPSDINGDGNVNVADLLAVIGAWGACPGCPEDVNGDGNVNVADLLAVIGAWGACP